MRKAAQAGGHPRGVAMSTRTSLHNLAWTMCFRPYADAADFAAREIVRRVGRPDDSGNCPHQQETRLQSNG